MLRTSVLHPGWEKRIDPTRNETSRAEPDPLWVPVGPLVGCCSVGWLVGCSRKGLYVHRPTHTVHIAPA